MTSSKAKALQYVPHVFALNGHIQCCLYMWVELFQVKMRNVLKYERELFMLSDGGTIALDWHIDETGGKPKRAVVGRCQRPILACFSGLSGGNNNLYLYSVIKAAT